MPPLARRAAFPARPILVETCDRHHVAVWTLATHDPIRCRATNLRMDPLGPTPLRSREDLFGWCWRGAL